LIAALVARGDVAVGLLTGNIHEAARRKLSFYGLWEHFPFGGFGDEHEDRNHIAAAALGAARQHLGANSPSPAASPATPNDFQVLVIGDTLNDVRCGQSIGARCVAVATGSSTAEVLRTAGPEVDQETLAELDPILALLND
jgi:phosphoglycolate phosphatase-like HAD superfamily hydrolase